MNYFRRRYQGSSDTEQEQQHQSRRFSSTQLLLMIVLLFLFGTLNSRLGYSGLSPQVLLVALIEIAIVALLVLASSRLPEWRRWWLQRREGD